jgi:DNA-binding HxlR family transcriptional regulator
MLDLVNSQWLSSGVSRSYGQLCGLALALDAIGDRWSLLIVRELLVRRDGARYTDLREGLPGIATNLLADRLRDLESSGVVRREDPRPPVATPVFRLTERGQVLLPAVEALAVWGGNEFVPSTPDDAEFRSRWMIIPIEAMLTDTRPRDPLSTIAIRTGDEPLTVTVGGGRIVATTVQTDDPDLVIGGPAKAILGLLAGKLPVAVAAAVGVEITGDRAVLERIDLHYAQEPFDG